MPAPTVAAAAALGVARAPTARDAAAARRRASATRPRRSRVVARRSQPRATTTTTTTTPLRALPDDAADAAADALASKIDGMDADARASVVPILDDVLAAVASGDAFAYVPAATTTATTDDASASASATGVVKRVRAPGEVERFENAQRSSVFSQIGFERWGGGVGVAALQRTLGMYNNQIDADVLDEGAKLKLRISPAAPRFQRFQRFAINGFNVRSTVSTFDQRFQRSIASDRRIHHHSTFFARVLAFRADPGLNQLLVSRGGSTVSKLWTQDTWERHRAVSRYWRHLGSVPRSIVFTRILGAF
jgi:hypothetical protein